MAYKGDLGEKLAEGKMKVTVQHLPDEILMQILEFVFDDDDGMEASSLQKHFPLVCKRWRTLVNAIPRFWNRVHMFRSPSYIGACLERTKNLGIDLGVFINKAHEKKKNMPTKAADFCSQLLPHSQRWESFYTSALNVTTSPAQALSESTRSHCGLLELPNLRSLHITWTSGDVTSDEERMHNNNLHLYSSWSMPNLTRLEAFCFIPCSCIGHTLTACELYFGPERCIDMELLFVFLRSLIRAQELTLSFLFVDDDTWPAVPISIPTLLKLSLNFQSEAQNASELVPLLDIPNATDIGLEATLERWGEPHDLLLCFGQEGSYASVKRFSLRVQRSSTVFDQHINTVFDTFRNLEHLGIEAHDAFRRLRSPFNCRSLRSLHFNRCDAFNGNIAEAIINHVESDGRLEEFEKLEVIICPTFRDRRYTLLNKLAKEKTDWERLW